MSATTETPVAPAVAAPATEAKPISAVVQKVPRYRRLDAQCVANLRKLDPGSVKTVDLPERIQKLAQNVFLESSDIFSPGSYVGFELKVPKRDTAYQANGVVRWISDDPKGFGLQIFEVTAEKAAASSTSAPAAPAGEARFSLPEPATISELLGGLLGKTIEVKPTGVWAPSDAVPATVAAFGPEDGPPCCLWVFDMAASIFAGAALTMVAVEEAKQAVQAKDLRESFVENVREILNVGASLFNNGNDSHVKLKETYVSNKDMPDTVKQLLAQPPKRMDLDIDVPDYGKGKICVIVS